MFRFPQRLALSGVACALLLAGCLVAWAAATDSSEAQTGSMQSCPSAGMWSIAVWDGADGTTAADALATCAGPVDAAYSLDAQTGVWSRWFAANPGVSDLASLDDREGVLALGSATGPVATPTPTATPAATPAATPTAMPLPTWTGVWETTYGNMELSQSDGTVTGTYEVNQGKIEGTVQGNKLIGTWSEPPSYAPPDEAGDIEFTLSSDGNSFVGRYRYGSSGDWGEWTGTRIG